MQINKIQSTNSPSFNAMLRIKSPANVINTIRGNSIVLNANEVLINPEAIEAIIPKSTGQILITTKNFYYEILTKIKENTLEKLDAACAKAKSLGTDAKAVEFID